MRVPVEITKWALGQGRYQADLAALVVLPGIRGERYNFRATNFSSSDRYDSSYSAKVTTSVQWRETTSGGSRFVEVDYYDIRWDRLDSQVGWRYATSRVGCGGPYLSGGTCNSTNDKNIGTPTSGTTYRHTPSWAGQYVHVDTVYFLSEVNSIELWRGGSVWELSMSMCHGGGDIMSCDVTL